MAFPYTSLVSVSFTLAILLAAFVVLKPFLLAVVWAAVIALASWPLHRRIRSALGNRPNLSAACSTSVIALTLVVPMVLLAVFMINDLYAVGTYLVEADDVGKLPPVWLGQMPWVGGFLIRKWELVMAHPHELSRLSQEWLFSQLNQAPQLAQYVLVDFSSRLATLAFALWVLFFFYREGDGLVAKINFMGHKWLQRRWPSYSHSIPGAVRGAVNGLVIVGFCETLVFSALFAAVGIPSAVLLGALAAILALVPLAAPALLALIGVMLAAQGATLIGMYVFFFGTAVVMAADYIVRPWLIRGDTELPFLAVLFGFLGGIATMGIVGLIIGPVILALLLVLLREATLDDTGDLGL
ncbi:AI-2E family transporter [Sulfurimicrobium lacus]|uniref:AI-2E family transporter n=1 Tax=Sulfurimicrobium lacus TaxID=2715678 RepID=A0A6F8VEU3_9PROT|nr:AI-2E family transporter [Sulfurimicrobium lacus]BCB27239.1 AI-2E family transporter [Sulfurimicrobium lacus]